ncbi:MAG: hypothetical protein HY393_04640 [Candidatus Diapherotrites archaeon]|nr:hypothetical protein [Candidatus Diapherotrites archaeon]
MKEKKTLLWALLVTLLLTIGCTTTPSTGLASTPDLKVTAPQPLESTAPVERPYYSILENAAQEMGISIEGARAQFNEKYGVAHESQIFSQLPELPNDFFAIQRAFEEGALKDLEGLEPAYYLQPEFIPEFQKTALPFWTLTPQYHGSTGYGSYPHAQYAQMNTNPNETATAFVLVYASWGIPFPQGMQLQADAQTQKYFDVRIEPNPFVMGPSFPVFDTEWIHKVRIDVTPKEGTPPGTYNIELDAFPPNQEKSYQWAQQIPEYKDIGTQFKPGKALIELELTLTEN